LRVTPAIAAGVIGEKYGLERLALEVGDRT
jgi:hypothetical protein